jgi:7-carboxy-7-deazaguanine synthase (Cx14CxxC type)
MRYSVKEVYYTLQGEGFHTGRAAVFLRFAGCNLWTGRETDRPFAICRFCDTDFVGTDGPGGGKFDSAESLAQAVAAQWPDNASSNGPPPFVVCTGGEPLLQLDLPLLDALHVHGYQVAIETNGTRVPPPGIDWICCSPKAGADLVLRRGDELKFVFPQADVDPQQYLDLEFRHFFLQPMDGPEREKNTELAMRYCREHPRWRLSLQTHKILCIL